MGLGAIIAVNGTAAEDLMASGVVDFIEVYERLGETTYYNIQFRIGIVDDDISLLADSRLAPGAELSILVTNGDATDCLVKGPIFSHEVNLQNGGDGSTVLVKGADASLKMDREFKSTAFEGSDSSAVQTILSSYGLTPDVGTTDPSHDEAKHTLIQRATDLQFVRKLARRNGYKFWVTSDALGVETAHFQRPNLDDETIAELKINRTDFNVNAIKLSWDSHRPSTAAGLQLDLANYENITGSVTASPLTPLGETTQQAFATDAVSIDLTAPVDDSGDLTARLEAAMIDANFFVMASCETSVNQLQSVVRAHKLVTLTGLGSVHSGKYLVGAVHHRIDETAHTMQVELMRNAVGASA